MMRTALIALLLAPVASAVAQGALGELRVRVSDPAGVPVPALVVVASEVTRTVQRITADDRGLALAANLPFGPYTVSIQLPGFRAHDAVVDVRSAVPIDLSVKLELAGIETEVTVKPDTAGTLLDPSGSGPPIYLGVELLHNPPPAPPGRSLIEMINAQPGWLLEANGTLHPRGSEYQVQYVVDGVPLRDNRSPAFSRAMAGDAYETVSVRTAGYPAEYGGKLGGVIEVITRREHREGWHGAASLSAGSFTAVDGSASGRFVKGRTGAGLGLELMRTDRYLDPPTEANHTNAASGTGLSAHVDHRWAGGDRTRVTFERQRTTFLVPNEEFQAAAGQRQEREARETRLQASHQRVLSPRLLLEAAGMVRSTDGRLRSNAFATPIRPDQDRALRQVYGHASFSAHLGMHHVKAGVEAGAAKLRERFSSTIVAYEIGGVEIFDDDLPEHFTFADERTQHEQAAYVQDLIRAGPVSASIGLRWDRTRLLRAEQAWSPRLAASWYHNRSGVLFRGSYDRVFQTPEMEGLLIASADLSSELDGHSLPLLASRGNFYEVGASRVFAGRVRLDANYFLREADNLADDELLLNTAVAFPIAFASGRVEGFEARADLPAWAGWSGSAAYSLSKGVGRLPVAGGLLLGAEIDELIHAEDTFPLTQDQRHTIRGRVQYQIRPRIWVSAASRYDSGLPVEIDGDPDLDLLAAQYGDRIVSRVDFARGRVKPSLAVDVAVGGLLWSNATRSLRIRFDVTNLANRINVINFAGLLSGTAIGSPRAWSLRLDWAY